MVFDFVEEAKQFQWKIVVILRRCCHCNRRVHHAPCIYEIGLLFMIGNRVSKVDDVYKSCHFQKGSQKHKNGFSKYVFTCRTNVRTLSGTFLCSVNSIRHRKNVVSYLYVLTCRLLEFSYFGPVFKTSN
jgi:hypothetical protein